MEALDLFRRAHEENQARNLGIGGNRPNYAQQHGSALVMAIAGRSFEERSHSGVEWHRLQNHKGVPYFCPGYDPQNSDQGGSCLPIYDPKNPEGYDEGDSRHP